MTISGIGKLTGSVNREYKILKADQTITASDISLRPYETAKITVSGAQGALSYKTSAKAVATVAKDGTVTAVKAGTASITISAAETDNYKAATAQLAVTVNAYDLSSSDCKVTLSQTTAVYNGKEIKPTATVKFGDITLKESTDYTVSYENNVNAGNGAVTIVGNDKTTVNSAKASFTIAKASQEISTDAPADGLKIKIGESAKITVSGAQGDVTFAVADPAVATVAADGAGAGSGAGAAVTATVSAVKAGSTKITVNAAETDNYEAAKALEIVVKVVPATIDVSELQITVDDSGLVYDGKAKTPAVTIRDKYGKTLKKGTDYKLIYSSNINAGTNTGKVSITGTGSYSGTTVKTFTIKKAAQPLSIKVSSAKAAVGKTVTVTVTGAKGKKTYSSSAPTVAAVSDTGVVTAKKVGTTTVKAVAAETTNYLKTTKTIKINVVPAATASLLIYNQQTGFKLSWKKVTGATGYDIYRGSVKIKTISGGSVGTYYDKSTLTNGGKYVYRIYARASTGVSTLSRSATAFRLNRPSITSVKNTGAGQMTVTWALNSRATGYQIQYCLNGDFGTARSVTVNGASTLKRVIKSLTRGRIWYVRIRSFKTVDNHKYYSMWSPVRKITITR